MNIQIQQKILNDINLFNSFQLSELLDYIDFLKRKVNTIAPETKVIDNLCGKYANQISNSEEFAKKKIEEMTKEDHKWLRK